MSNKLNHLQIGRGLAAFAVAAFHLSITLGRPDAPPFGDWLQFGRLGVDFFFVLSGFIILYAHQGEIGQRAAAGVYAFKRIVRIYPLYWLIVAVTLALAAARGAVDYGAAEWASFVLLIHFAPGQGPLGVAWTLFHEVLFYAFFVTLIIDRRLGYAVFGLWLVAILANFEYPAWGPFTLRETVFGAYNLNFFFGMAAMVIARRLSPRASAWWLAAGLALVAGLSIYEHEHGEVLALRLPYGLAFTAIVAGLAALDFSGVAARSASWLTTGLVFLGDASYSIYLTHLSFNGVGIQLTQRLGLQSALPVPVVFFLVLSMSVAAGCLVHLVIEKRLIQATKRWLPVRVSRPVPV